MTARLNPLQLRLIEDLLPTVLAEMQADIRQAVGAPLADGRVPADPLEVLPVEIAALLRRCSATDRFES